MNLRPFVNDKVLWKDFVQELDDRIAFCHKQLEQANDTVTLYRFQGEIAALRKMKLLRDKVNNGG